MSNTVASGSRVPNNLRFRRTFGAHQEDHRHPEPDRDPEALVRRVPAARRRRRRARKDQGLQAVFKSVFPIKDFNETASLEFVSYTLGEPKYDVDECHQRGMTFAAPLKVTVQLVIWDVDPESGARSIKNVKEQEVYFGEIPLMTAATARSWSTAPSGSSSRQLHRSPGRLLRPRQGQDARQRQAALLGAHHPVPRLVDRLRVRPARHPLRPHRPAAEVPRHRAAARPRHDHRGPAQLLLPQGHDRPRRPQGRRSCSSPISWSASRRRATSAIPAATSSSSRKGASSPRRRSARWRQAGVEQIPIALEEVLGRVSAHDVEDPKTGEVLLECNEEITDGEARACCAQRGINAHRGAVPRRHAHRAVAAQHAAAGQDRRARRRRSSRSTGACAPAIRRRPRPRRRSSTTCSSTPSATTCRASAA